MELNNYLKERGLLGKKSIESAFYSIDRADFVPEKLKKFAYKDIPLQIGSGQTISQPQVVAFMIDLLDVKEGDKVLDIGFGSGWTTALLAEIVRQKNNTSKDFSSDNFEKKGKVVGLEILSSLYEYGKSNISKYNFIERKIVELFLEDGRNGKKEIAPYDCVLVSAADKDKNLPKKIINQIKENGKMVLPVKNSIFLFEKKGNYFIEKEYLGFSFVPLV